MVVIKDFLIYRKQEIGPSCGTPREWEIKEHEHEREGGGLPVKSIETNDVASSSDVFGSDVFGEYTDGN